MKRFLALSVALFAAVSVLVQPVAATALPGGKANYVMSLGLLKAGSSGDNWVRLGTYRFGVDGAVPGGGINASRSPCYRGNSHVYPLLQIIDDNGGWRGWVGVEAAFYPYNDVADPRSRDMLSVFRVAKT
ncbi:hypothetical protein [Nonomuraea sp. SYSU D8015]|uniref:hypothetical protein n=1 Tax=Nonomuraea sp. SYSU D8015 TaxID=2593644 RepID=UPI0016617AA1|nr:hypothetical protein [Nonomuraea sp. SYSU D8015]